MDYGKLTDNNGKTVDFRNIILIMTTNAGASDMSKPVMGFGQTTAARGRGHRGDQAPVHARVPQPARRGHRLPRPDADDHPQRGRQVRQGAGRPAGRQAGLDRARRRGGGLAGREGLRPALWRAAAGPRHPGPDQAAARRRAAVRQARQGRQGLRDVADDELVFHIVPVGDTLLLPRPTTAATRTRARIRCWSRWARAPTGEPMTRPKSPRSSTRRPTRSATSPPTLRAACVPLSIRCSTTSRPPAAPTGTRPTG